MSLVDPGRPEGPEVAAPASSRTTLVASLAAHAAVAAALVVVPLFAQVRLPTPSRPIEAYINAVAVARIPAALPPGRPSTRPAAPSPSAAPASSSQAAAPTEAPTTIGTGEAAAPPAGVPTGGVPHAGLGEVTGGLPAPPALAVPPPPPAPVSKPLRVGGDIRAPRKLHHVAPVYPPIAAQARIGGTVILDATISPTGEVVDVRVLRSVPLLDAAAVTAVRQWRYDPPRLNGTPVAVLLTVTVQFAQ
jgi:protein TonB